MVEHRGEALPGLDPLRLYEGQEVGWWSTGVKHYLVLIYLACMKVRRVGWWSTGVKHYQVVVKHYLVLIHLA